MRISCFLGTVSVLALAGCSATNSRVVTRLNADAALAGNIPNDPMQWRVITSGVDPGNSTMFTLFGNDAAVRYARTNTARAYPESSALALATWHQQEDSRWFGGKIPAQVTSVEFVEIGVPASGMLSTLYRAYKGSPLQESAIPKTEAEQRTTYILSLRAAVMP